MIDISKVITSNIRPSLKISSTNHVYQVNMRVLLLDLVSGH